MFTRVKKAAPYEYLQIVENQWRDGKSHQRVIWTIGRVDRLKEKGTVDKLLRSLAKYSERALLLLAGVSDPNAEVVKIGPGLIFERLWQTSGIKEVIKELLKDYKFSFDVERAIFLTVLHRLFSPGSDRRAERWRKGYRIKGVEKIQLHHLYRAMAWLGSPLGDEEQDGATPFAPRCLKDVIEEKLFARNLDLFSELTLAFFDTTSLYFEGEGGETIGQHGHSKDHRPDLKQMVVGVVLDGEGNPICCELWPGNTTDVQTLLPVVDRLKKRFHITQICIVSDRGMISKKTIEELEKPPQDIKYILGVRMHKQKEVSQEVLSRAGAYRVVHPERTRSKDPSPLKVKEIQVGERRYLLCYNPEQARKDAQDREAIVQSLKDKLKQGDKSLVGNKGYRRYLASKGPHFIIDEKKVKEDARYDGKWVLRTNTDLPTDEVALKYKQLWTVERIFRETKSLLQTRPIFHKCDETIRGHVFSSFLALVVRKELDRLLQKAGHKFEWQQIKDDLKNLQDTHIKEDGKELFVRSQSRGCCGKVFQAVGVALPPTLRSEL